MKNPIVRGICSLFITLCLALPGPAQCWIKSVRCPERRTWTRRGGACPAHARTDAGIGVFQYDADYDTLAEVLPFESCWIAPRGSLD